MAKYTEVSEFNADIFQTQVEEADLHRYLNVKVLADDRQKTIFKVIKANPLVKHMTNEDVIIIINEKIFDGLEDNQKRLVADEAVTYFSFDSEKDRLVMHQPDLTTFRGVIRKYTFEVYEALVESIQSLYDAKNNDEAQNGIGDE
jgi:hypothetical protein